MLGKLLKHEWKETYKMGILMMIVMLGVTFLGWLSFQSPMWKAMANDVTYDNAMLGIVDLMSVLTLMLYVVMLMAVPIGLIIYLVVRFYKTMYTDQGYLTHTLPVTKHQLLISKIIVSGIWELLLTVAICISVMGLLVFMISAVLPDGYSFADFWDEFCVMFGAFMTNIFEDQFGMNMAVYLIYLVVSLVLSSFSSIIILFGAVTLGQLFTKYRVLMAIVSYVGLIIVNGILTAVLEGIITAIYAGSDSASAVGSYFNVNMVASLILSIVIAGVMYVVSYQINRKKLNLE